ncbi:hypothetical protein ACSU1N_00840 [Thermogladius sp. 4427co]|uniref:hypothetical protein n=1 Tax=Thermogladius sp. 4427co TaxID=3450718 RepID=UPI003F7AB57E
MINIVYKTLFLKGEEGFRKAASWSKILFLASALLLFVKPGLTPAVVVFAILLVLSAIWPGFEWFVSGVLVSAVPAFWFSLTAYMSGILGLPGVGLAGAIVIFSRTIAFSILILFTASIISPVRVSNLMLRLKSPAYFPLLLWRTIPYGLKNTIDSLQIGVLKKEKAYKRLAPAVAIMLEYGGYIEEYNWFKLESKPLSNLPSSTSVKYTLILLLSSLILFTLCILV